MDEVFGMNVAGVELRGNKLRVNPAFYVNESTTIVLATKRNCGRSGLVLWGGVRNPSPASKSHCATGGSQKSPPAKTSSS